MQIKFTKKEIKNLEKSLSNCINDTLGTIYDNGAMHEIIYECFFETLKNTFNKNLEIKK